VWAKKGKFFSFLLCLVMPVYGEEIQVYDIIDSRFCHLTPSPFICERCLKAGMQPARILRFDDEGRPYREMTCVPFPEKQSQNYQPSRRPGGS
jgi:hypothetical protein